MRSLSKDLAEGMRSLNSCRPKSTARSFGANSLPGCAPCRARSRRRGLHLLLHIGRIARCRLLDVTAGFLSDLPEKAAGQCRARLFDCDVLGGSILIAMLDQQPRRPSSPASEASRAH